MKRFEESYLTFLRSLAKKNGWEEIEETKDSHMVSFHKVINGKPARLNVWDTGTVGTYLSHPKQGKTQLFRRFVNRIQMAQIFNDPRTHMGKGYR